MPNVKNTNTKMMVSSDEWSPNPNLPDIPILISYITSIALKTDATERVSKRAELHYKKSLPEDYTICKERALGERKSRQFSIKREERANSINSATEQRKTKFEGEIKYKWNKHDFFMYITQSSFTIIGLLVALTFITATIYNSGVVQIFSEHIGLAMLVATAPIFGVLTAKSALKLFNTERGQLFFKRYIYLAAFIAFISWAITYVLVFDTKSTSELLANLGNSSEESSYYQLWLFTQILTETLCAAAIGISAQDLYHGRLKKRSVRNPVWDKSNADEIKARTNIRMFDNRIAINQHYIEKCEIAIDDYIEECLGYLFHVQEELNLASLNKLSEMKNECSKPNFTQIRSVS